MDPEYLVFAAAKLTIDELSDDELVTMNLCAQHGNDPRKCIGYEKAKSLFTSEDANGMPVMHEMVKDILAQVVMERLG